MKVVTEFVGIGVKGVDLFVVISGFCLFYPVLKRASQGLPQHSSVGFYRRRINRIGPVYLSAIVFALAVIGLGYRTADNRGLADVWPYLLFIQNMMPDYIARVNGPLWSVALEMQLYLLFPVFAWVFLRRRGVWLVLVAAVVSYVASIADEHGWFVGRTFDPSKTHTLPARAVQFVLGMAAASICVNDYRRIRFALYAAVPFAAVVALMAEARSQQASPTRHYDAIAWGVVGAAIVVALIQIDHSRGRIPSWLAPIQRLGLISFSVYVVHFPIMLAMQPFMASYLHGPIQSILLFTITGLPLTLAIGIVLFYVVERHTLNVGKEPIPPPKMASFPPAEPNSCDTMLLATAAIRRSTQH